MATRKKTPAKTGTKKISTDSESVTKEVVAAPFEGGIAPELPKEDLKIDVVETSSDALNLQDSVTVNDEDLPKIDEVPINKGIIEYVQTEGMVVDTSSVKSIFDKDVEIPEAPVAEEAPKTEEREWVRDPSLLRKTEGFKDTLTGPLYKGVRKSK